MDCKTCRKNQNLKTVEPVPYVAHEAQMARNERTIKRLIIALALVAILWFSTVCLFVWYLNQYDCVSYDQDGTGVNIIGDSNGVDYNVAET